MCSLKFGERYMLSYIVYVSDTFPFVPTGSCTLKYSLFTDFHTPPFLRQSLTLQLRLFLICVINELCLYDVLDFKCFELWMWPLVSVLIVKGFLLQ